MIDLNTFRAFGEATKLAFDLSMITPRDKKLIAGGVLSGVVGLYGGNRIYQDIKAGERMRAGGGY